MSFTYDIKDKIKKLAVKIDKLNDGFDEKYLRFSNKALVLLKKGDRYVLAVIASSKTKKWLANNLEVKCHSKEYGKVAYTFDGMPNKLEWKADEKTGLKTLTYDGTEVAPLFEHSTNSLRLFWTIKKFNALDKYKEEQKLNIVNLIVLQDELDDELALEHPTKAKTEEDEELTM